MIKIATAALALAGAALFTAPASAQTYSQQHIDWCTEQHPSYSVATNKYSAGSGMMRECSSPYDDNFDVVDDEGNVANPTYSQNRVMADDMAAQHTEWCNTRYPSYNASSNTYKSGSAIRKVCSSPYN